jgi:hypothetical protein
MLEDVESYILSSSVRWIGLLMKIYLPFGTGFCVNLYGVWVDVMDVIFFFHGWKTYLVFKKKCLKNIKKKKNEAY